MEMPPENNQEKIMREEAISAYRKFVDQGITNPDVLGNGEATPIGPENPEVKVANELFYKWVAQIDSEAEGNEELKHRANLAKNMFYVDAGFTDPIYLEEVLDEWILNDKPQESDDPERIETLRVYTEAENKINTILGRI